MNREEDHIQMAIVQYLEIRKHFYFSIPNEAIGAGKNEVQAKIRGHRLKLMGRRPGVADLFVSWNFGVVSFLEVKSLMGSQSSAQKAFEKEITKRGIRYDVVRSVDDVMRIEKILRDLKKLRY